MPVWPSLLPGAGVLAEREVANGPEDFPMNPFQPLKIAGRTLLNQRSGTMPDVTGAINNWFKPIVIGQIKKETINAQLVETVTEIQTVGMLTPGKRVLEMKPEGQRRWANWQLFVIPSCELKVDDRITIVSLKKGDTPYRVMSKQDFSDSGYIAYDLVEDYHYAIEPTPENG